MTDPSDGSERAGLRQHRARQVLGQGGREAERPAVPSISLTLDQLVTETRVRFDPSLEADLVRLDGRRATAAEAERVIAMLDRVRREAGFG